MLKSLFTLQIEDPVERRIGTSVIIVAGLLIFASVVLTGWAIGLASSSDQQIYIPVFVAAFVLSTGSIWLVKNNYIQYSSFPLLLVLLITPLMITIRDVNVAVHEPVLLIFLGIMLITLLVGNEQFAIGANLFAMILFLVVFLIMFNRDSTSGATTAQFFYIGTTMVIAIGLSLLIVRSMRQVVNRAMEAADTRRLNLTETSNAVTRRIFSRQNLETLLNETVEIVREQFETIYHAQVFLLDRNKQSAVLRASTGEPGRILLERNFSLDVGSRSVIGQVTSTGEAVLVQIDDPIHKFNEILPDTQTELALPLRVGDEIIGALDIQSTRYHAFEEGDISIFQALADQIAIAIDNAQILEKLRVRVEENLRLYRQELRNREEIERLNQELVGRAWGQYFSRTSVIPAQTLDIVSGHVRAEGAMSSLAEQTAQTARVQQLTDEKFHHIAIPITVRGVTIAVLEFDIPPGKTISETTYEALNSIGERVGFIAENARLFNNAQTIAWREKTVGDIVAELQGARDLPALLQNAAEAFNRVLGTEYTSIRLGRPDNRSSE